MNTKIRKNFEEYKYQCKDCGMFYKTKELAEACEKWCTEHQSCNLEIIKQGIAPDEIEN